MLRKKSKAVLEGNGLIPQDAYVMLGGIALKELRPIMSEAVDNAFDELTENMASKGKSAFSKPGAGHSVATSCHGGRRIIRHQDSQSYGGCCRRSSDKCG